MKCVTRYCSRLAPFRRLAIYAIGIGVWITGVLWLAAHYFLVGQGPFGPVLSPFEPWTLTLHGAFAFGAIWVFGMLSGAHIPAGWSGQRRRVSGSVLAAILGWLIVSGYLLYYLGNDQLRSAASVSHWTIGLVVPVSFLAHWLKRRRRVPLAELCEEGKI